MIFTNGIRFPAPLLDWAGNNNYTTGAASGSGNKSEPSQALCNEGLTVGSPNMSPQQYNYTQQQLHRAAILAKDALLLPVRHRDFASGQEIRNIYDAPGYGTATAAVTQNRLVLGRRVSNNSLALVVSTTSDTYPFLHYNETYGSLSGGLSLNPLVWSDSRVHLTTDSVSDKRLVYVLSAATCMQFQFTFGSLTYGQRTLSAVAHYGISDRIAVKGHKMILASIETVAPYRLIFKTYDVDPSHSFAETSSEFVTTGSNGRNLATNEWHPVYLEFVQEMDSGAGAFVLVTRCGRVFRSADANGTGWFALNSNTRFNGGVGWTYPADAMLTSAVVVGGSGTIVGQQCIAPGIAPSLNNSAMPINGVTNISDDFGQTWRSYPNEYRYVRCGGDRLYYLRTPGASNAIPYVGQTLIDGVGMSNPLGNPYFFPQITADMT